MAKHPSKTLKWKWQSVKNWFYNNWIKWRNRKRPHEEKEVPYLFNFTTNKYEYAPRNVDEEQTDDKGLEEAHYDTVPPTVNQYYPYTDWENLHRKHEKLKELRRNG